VAVLQVALVQRTFRRSLPHWLDALGRYRLGGQPAGGVRRLADALARSASTYALAELERVAADTAETDGDPAQRLPELLDAIRREMHPAEDAPRTGRAAMVASDDPELAARLAAVAGKYAQRVEVFPSASAARAFANRNWPGLVLLDARIPGDGLGWLADLRGAPEGPELPIVVASPRGEDRPDALALGASEFAKLPLDEAAMDELVGSWLGHEVRTMLELAGDPVTGLPGPGVFQEAVVDQSIRNTGRRWAVVLVIWRNRGQLAQSNLAAANEAARALAASLSARFPEPALVARLDQETFALLIPDVDADELPVHLEVDLVHLERVPAVPVDLGIGGVLCFEADYTQILATARRMHQLGAVAGQRVLVTTIDEAPPQRALLVHHDPGAVELLREALRGTRMELVHRRTAVEGLELAASVDVDLVLIGASLPDQAGFDLLRSLRGMTRYEARPIVVLTTEDRERVRAYELGADECLALPVSPAVLRARLRGRLQRA
jgi:DNA-binding response OmpR family regulator/GGDEF domain-containing protein